MRLRPQTRKHFHLIAFRDHHLPINGDLNQPSTPLPFTIPNVAPTTSQSLSPSPIDLLDDILALYDTYFEDDIFHDDTQPISQESLEHDEESPSTPSTDLPFSSNISDIGASYSPPLPPHSDTGSDSALNAHHHSLYLDTLNHSAMIARDFSYLGTSLEFIPPYPFAFAPLFFYPPEWRVAPFSPTLLRVDPLLSRPHPGKDPPF